MGRLTLRVSHGRAAAALFQPAVFARHTGAPRAALAASCGLQSISPRKVRQVVAAVCGETVNASLVSAAAKRLDAALAGWRAVG